MEFFDANCFLGLPAVRVMRPVATAEDLLAEMDAAGVAKALVWHVSQRDHAAPAGNELLARGIAEHHDRLVGCWSVLPPQTDELPGGEEFFRQMAKAGVRALRVFPKLHRFLLRSETFGPLLEETVARRIPLLLSLDGAVDWENIYDLLREFPELVCIVCDAGVWGMDRQFRPLVERYPNCYVEISPYYLDGGIESFVERYGPRQLLYGSGMPMHNYGGMMLTLRHAEIGEADRQAIAAGNLRRILDEVKL